MEAILESLELARLIVNLIADKKGEEVVLMDLRTITEITDYFVIASAPSERQLNAITDYIRDEIKTQDHLYPRRIEGRGEHGWILLDYGDVLIHLFAPDMRSYYDLEGLWQDANVVVRMQ